MHSYYQTPISDEYRMKHPEDVSFANYIRALELAGLTREHMEKTGLLDQIQKKEKLNSEIEAFTFDHHPSSKQITTLSDSFRKRFPIVKGMNDDILESIIKMEKIGHAPEQIVLELHLPSAMVEQLSKDIPNLNKNLPSEVVEKIK